MKNLQLHNSRYITYTDELFTIDVLGGVDMEHIERMICTLRIRYQDYPPVRATFDLYSDPQTDQLIRNLCDAWELTFAACSGSIHGMVMQLEDHRLDRLRYPRQHPDRTHELSEAQRQEAISYLSNPDLVANLQGDLKCLGIAGGYEDDENALILFLAMASRTYSRPLSVVCITDGNRHYSLLEKLSACLPEHQRSLHTHISDNALYYFERHQLDGKVLFIEDLSWTPKMLKPLAALHSTRRLSKTQATKSKEGLLYATTYEVAGKLCMIARTTETQKAGHGNLPFLAISLHQSPARDTSRMHYEKQCRAGLIDPAVAMKAQSRLRALLQSLPYVTIRNPYAPFIELPPELEYPERAMLILLDFIEVITFFFQHQREQLTDPESGEIYIKSTAEDVTLAFGLLQHNLLSGTDDVSAPAKAIYHWLQDWTEAKDKKTFTASEIRAEKHIHPRSLNRYLKELCFFHYLTIGGGNKYRGGYRYRLADFPEPGRLTAGNEGTDAYLESILERVRKYHGGTPEHGESPANAAGNSHATAIQDRSPEPISKKNGKRLRIEEGAGYTLKCLRTAEGGATGGSSAKIFTSHSAAALTGRSPITEGRYLKELTNKGILERSWHNRQYHYRLLTTGSGTVGQSPVSKPPSPAQPANQGRTTAKAQRTHM